MTTSPIPAPDLVEPRQRPWWREFVALWAFGLREYRIWQSYRVNQVLWMTNILVTTLLFFLLGKTIAGQSAHLLGSAYGTNYMSFVVICAGYGMLAVALRRAEHGGGIGVVV